MSLFSFSQNHTITSVVFDDKEKPLESANINAKPLTEKVTLNLLLPITKVAID